MFCCAGRRGLQMEIAPADLIEATGAKVAGIAAALKIIRPNGPSRLWRRPPRPAPRRAIPGGPGPDRPRSHRKGLNLGGVLRVGRDGGRLVRLDVVNRSRGAGREHADGPLGTALGQREPDQPDHGQGDRDEHVQPQAEEISEESI